MSRRLLWEQEMYLPPDRLRAYTVAVDPAVPKPKPLARLRLLVFNLVTFNRTTRRGK